MSTATLSTSTIAEFVLVIVLVTRARWRLSHLIRYYGWYSNKSRGTRRKAAEAEAAEQAGAAATNSPLLLGEGQGMRAARCSQTWAMLIKRVYEIDPLRLPEVPGPDEAGRLS